MTRLEKIKSDQASGGFVALLFAVMFVGLAIILHFNPLLIDDYEFLSYNYQSIGEAINYALCYGNGRFLGNLGAILLAPHTIIAAVFKASTVSLLCILLPKILNATKKTTYLLSCLLILTVPEKMFAQVHAWNCGNVNYISPILLTILCFLILKAESKGGVVTILKCFGVFLLGFCSQLFMEHNTLVNFLIAASLFIFLTIKRKTYGNDKCIISFFWVVATALGMVAMLVIPKLFTGERTWDVSTYRGLDIDSPYAFINRILENGAEIISHFASNFTLLLVLGIIVHVMLCSINFKKQCFKHAVTLLKAGNAVCLCFDTMYCLFLKNMNTDYSEQRILIIAVCAVCVLQILIFFISSFICPDSKKRIIVMICLILFVSSLVPLLIIHPIGDRTSFFGTVILIFTAIYLYSETVTDIYKTYEIRQRFALIAATAAMICCLFVSFYSINGYMKRITQYIDSEMAKGAETIEIFRVPIRYCHNSAGLLRYRYYYNEYGDITFKIISFDEWIENRNNEKNAELQSQPQQ